MVSSLWLSGRTLRSKLLASRSPLFSVHSFSSAVFPEGYFSRMLPLTLCLCPSRLVSTNPVPGFPSREQELYGWLGSQSSFLLPCSPTWRALLCHMGGENTHHPSSDDLPSPNKLCFLLHTLSRLWHDARTPLHN